MAGNRNGRSNPERQRFEQDLITHISALTGFARSLTGNMDKAGDIVQETLVRALAHWKDYSPDTNMKAWLFVIARNEFYSGHRRAKTAAGYVASQLSTTSEASESLQVSEAEAAYELHQLLAYLPMLARDQADALVAVSYLGLSYDEAAAFFDCAVGTIKSRTSRARLQLLSLMESIPPPKLSLERIQVAAEGIPRGHKQYPLAKAYQDLYRLCTGTKPPGNGPKGYLPVALDKDWVQIVASGALDLGQETLSDLMSMDAEDFI